MGYENEKRVSPKEREYSVIPTNTGAEFTPQTSGQSGGVVKAHMREENPNKDKTQVGKPRHIVSRYTPLGNVEEELWFVEEVM